MRTSNQLRSPSTATRLLSHAVSLACTAMLGCVTEPVSETFLDASPSLEDAARGDASVTHDAEMHADAGVPDAARNTRPDAAPDAAHDAALSPPVEVVAGAACDSDPSAPSGSSCQVLQVTCGGFAPMRVELRSSPRTSGSLAGIVMLGSGGNGTRFSDGFRVLIRDLRARGFDVLERRWSTDSEAGWILGGMGPGACRYTELMRWVDTHVRTGDAPLCVEGNSGGAGEVGAALAQHHLDSLVDLALMSSGPMPRLDYACGRNETWAPLCDTLVASHPWACPGGTPSCNALRGSERGLFDAAFAEPNACSDPTSAHLDLLQAASAITGDAQTNFATDVRVFVGSDDCSIAPSHGLHFASLTSSRGRPVPATVVVGAPHELPSSSAGRDAIFTAIIDGCVRR